MSWHKCTLSLKLFDFFPRGNDSECYHVGSELLRVEDGPGDDRYRILVFPCHKKLEYNIMILFERLRDNYRLHFKGDTYVNQHLDSEEEEEAVIQLDMDYVGIKLDEGQTENICYVWKRTPGQLRDRSLRDLHFVFNYFYHYDQEPGDPIPTYMTELFYWRRRCKHKITKTMDRARWNRNCLCPCHYLHRKRTICQKEAPWVEWVDQVMENNPDGEQYVEAPLSDENSDEEDLDPPQPTSDEESPAPFWLMEGIDPEENYEENQDAPRPDEDG